MKFPFLIQAVSEAHQVWIRARLYKLLKKLGTTSQPLECFVTGHDFQGR
jgi:hypothetical protein